MQDIVAGHRASVEMLEFLAEQFNSANREADYCATLLRLFELYCKENKFEKAGEALDRAVEIDPYENGHQKRLQALKGKIDENRYQVISSRLGGTTPSTPAKVTEEKAIGSSTLQDLMPLEEAGKRGLKSLGRIVSWGMGHSRCLGGLPNTASDFVDDDIVVGGITSQ